jgi:putative sigma-54 modulation protein
MELSISYRHLDSTPSLDAKITEKAEHLKKYFQGKISVDWVCSVDGHEHTSEVSVHAGHTRFHAHAADKCLYHTLDSALSKMEKQLSRKNSKLKNKIHGNSKEMIMDYSE